MSDAEAAFRERSFMSGNAAFKTVLDEFCRLAVRRKMYETVEMRQTELDVWLKFYTTERPHQVYRNMGREPIETIMQFVSNET